MTTATDYIMTSTDKAIRQSFLVWLLKKGVNVTTTTNEIPLASMFMIPQGRASPRPFETVY
jgi:hypothetical protein